MWPDHQHLDADGQLPGRDFPPDTPADPIIRANGVWEGIVALLAVWGLTLLLLPVGAAPVPKRTPTVAPPLAVATVDPLADEVWQFGDWRPVAGWYAQLAESHWHYCACRLPMERDRPAFEEYTHRAHWRTNCWQCLDHALDPERDPEFRMIRLESLRDMIGDEVFAVGAMPTPRPCLR